MINSVTLVGNLVADAELISVKGKEGKTSLAKFAVAVNHNKEKVSYFNVEAWGALAEAISQFTKKGDKVAISGELVQNRWEDEDKNIRSTVKINARTIEFMNTKENENSSANKKKYR